MPKPIDRQLKPFWTTRDGDWVRLYRGDVLQVLKRLPSQSVHCCATSPPYWGLRSYATGDHKHLELGSEKVPDCGAWARGTNCAEIDWANACYVCRMVLVFRELRRVLHDRGVLWLNLGDSYNANVGKGFNAQKRQDFENRNTVIKTDLPPGNLTGIPWRTALALQADGWILRSDIPWTKRNPMPESVTNRPAKALEYVFLFAKKPGYYFDMEAVRKPPSYVSPLGNDTGRDRYKNSNGSCPSSGVDANPAGRSFRNADLWYETVDTPHGLTGLDGELVGLDVTSQGYAGAHFATFPPKLIVPLIKAGSSEHGCCASCGSPWKRIVEKVQLTRERPNDYVKRLPGSFHGGGKGSAGNRNDDDRGQYGNNSCANSVAGVETKTIGWEPTCECNGRFEKQTIVKQRAAAIAKPGYAGSSKGRHFDPDEVSETVETVETVYVSDLPLDEHPIVPCTVLDPFIGSGTSCCVAFVLGRRSVGIDLSEEYLRQNAIPRIEGTVSERPAVAHLVGPAAVKIAFGRPIG